MINTVIIESQIINSKYKFCKRLFTLTAEIKQENNAKAVVVEIFFI